MQGQMSRATELSGYRAALEDYLAGGGEAALLHAYEIGRQMLEAGLGVVDVVTIHQEAVADLHLPGAPGGVRDRGAPAADPNDVLAEALGAFEMVLRGYREANDSLRELSVRLEEEVRARTGDLERALADLSRVDAERQQLLERVVTAQEQERQRIAEDLHDDSVQLLVAIGLRLGVVRRHLPEPAPPELQAALARLASLEEEVARAIGRLRHLIFELHPSHLEDSGLGAALQVYLERLAAPDETPRYELVDRCTTTLPPHLGHALYRMAQEAIANARTHAHAQTVTVVVEDDDDGVLLSVSDDGIGFVPEAVRTRPGHLGLTAMRERAAMAGGWCRIDSAPQHGTRVRCWVPVVAG